MNKPKLTGTTTISQTGTYTFTPNSYNDDGFCHCDDICPCCGKRKRPKGYQPIYTVTTPYVRYKQ